MGGLQLGLIIEEEETPCSVTLSHMRCVACRVGERSGAPPPTCRPCLSYSLLADVQHGERGIEYMWGRCRAVTVRVKDLCAAL